VNKYIDEINEKVKNLKESTKSKSQIIKELNILRLNQLIYLPEMTKLYDEYKSIDSQLKSLNKENTKKKQELKNYSEKVFELYGKNINEYLKYFSTPFSIGYAKSVYKSSSKEPMTEYALELDGVELSFDEDKSSTVCIKYALSEGDKTSIAFAFFLAKLDLDSSIENKIIIYDDPISSLDKNRRIKTINQIIDKASKAKQTIVLSHNENFVFDLYNNSAINNIRTLKINYNTNIEKFNDIDEFMESNYYKALRRIDNFLSNPDDSKAKNLRGDVRIILEDNLKFRYYKYLNGISKSDGLGKMISILEASDCCFKQRKDQVINELRELNIFSASEHHGYNDKAHRKEEVTIPELITYLQNTISMIYDKL